MKRGYSRASQNSLDKMKNGTGGNSSPGTDDERFVCCLTFHSRIFHSYTGVTIVGEVLQNSGLYVLCNYEL